MNTSKLSILIISLTIIKFHVVTAQDGNWPQFRGPNACGHSQVEQNPPIEFNKEMNVIWKTNVPYGHSSPCIWEDKIFLTGYDKENQDFTIFSIDRKNGKVLWTRNIHVEEVERVHAISCPANATVATDGKNIYAYFGSYGLVSYDFEGEKQWEYQMSKPKSQHGTGTSPIIAGDLVILNCSNNGNDPCLVAVNKSNGDVVWKKDLPFKTYRHEGYCTPVIYKNQVIIYRRGEIAGYNLQDGLQVWWIDTQSSGTSTPIIVNDKLYVGTYAAMGDPEYHVEIPDYTMLISQNDHNNDNLIDKEEFPDDMFFEHRKEMGKLGGGKVSLKNFFGMMDPNKDNQLDSTEWENSRAFFYSFYTEHGLVAYKLGGEGDITLSNFMWKQIKGVPEVPSPIHCNGNIYMIKNGGITSCLDAAEGTLHYQERLGAAGPYIASPVVANENIYIPSRNGIITVFKANEKLEVLAKNDLDDILMATPAIVDNKLYIRTSESLYVFGK